MKKITAEMIMDKEPCEDWTEERVRKYIGKGKTLKEILEIKEVSEEDRIWCVTRFLPDKTNRAFAIWCAQQCRTDVQEIKDYIKVIKRYYAGKATDEELMAAERAAYWAADGAAYWVAERAAYRAAYWAAYKAAERAVERAAYMAADGAAAYWAAERAIMRKNQIERLLSMIK